MSKHLIPWLSLIQQLLYCFFGSNIGGERNKSSNVYTILQFDKHC